MAPRMLCVDCIFINKCLVPGITAAHFCDAYLQRRLASDRAPSANSDVDSSDDCMN